MTEVIFACGLVITFALAFLACLAVEERKNELESDNILICAMQAFCAALLWPVALPLGLAALISWSVFTKFISKNRNKANV